MTTETLDTRIAELLKAPEGVPSDPGRRDHLDREGLDVHALHPGQLSALAPAFPAGSRGQLRDEDVGVQGIVHHAPGSGLVFDLEQGKHGLTSLAARAHWILKGRVSPRLLTGNL